MSTRKRKPPGRRQLTAPRTGEPEPAPATAGAAERRKRVLSLVNGAGYAVLLAYLFLRFVQPEKLQALGPVGAAVLFAAGPAILVGAWWFDRQGRKRG